jgi:hypothetical protein
MNTIYVVKNAPNPRTIGRNLIRLTGGLLGALLLILARPASGVTLTTAEAAYSVLGKNTTVQAPMSFSGSVGVVTGGLLTLNSATIHGRVDYVGSINHTVVSSTITGGEFPNVALVGTAQSDAQSLATTISGLSGTAISNIMSSRTLTAGVYDLSTINLNSADLTLSGSATDQFILRVSSTFNLNTGRILLSGGAVADNVFLYFTGGSDPNFNGSSAFSGVLVIKSSQSRNISFNGSTNISGHVFNLTAGQNNFNNGTFLGETGPGISLSPTSLSFGPQLLGSASAPQTITLTNPGSAALTITSIGASGDFSQTNTCGASVASAGTCTISVTFTPTAAGLRTGTISVNDNAPGSPHTASLTGTGTTAPFVSLSPTSLGFGSQLLNTASAAQSVTLTNTGSAALTITSIAATGDFSQTNTCGATVAVSGTCSISVKFTPTATGSRTGSISVTDNATGSPHTVSLTGTGTVPAVSLAPTSLSFGNQLLYSASAAQSVTLTNTGSAALTITSIAASGDFSQTNTCGTSVAVAGTCAISVTFTPTAAGSRTGSVSITDNASGSPQTVSLTGTGTAPAVSFSPTSLSFGNQALNTASAAQSVTLTNTGSAALTITTIAANGDFSQTNTCGASVAAAGTCAISVTFTPTVAGSRTGAVSVTDNASGSPQTFSLTGTGITAPAISFSPTSLSLGNQALNTASTAQVVTLTNTGSAALTITTIAASGDFSQTNTCGASVAAAGTCTISVTFTPTVAGSRTGAVTVTDNATGSPHTVSLTGTGITAPATSFSPTSLTFGNQAVNSASAAQSVTLTNTGSAALTITSIAASGDFSQTNTCGASVAAAGTCTISVIFSPIATGSRTGAVSVTDNASGSPQTVSLAGTGIAAPVTSFSPATVTFSNQALNTASTPQVLTLSNTGTAALTITTIAASGDFSQTNTCGASVAAAANCSISVTFTPTATGSRTGAVSVTDNATGSPQTISLTGAGITAPAVSFSPSSLSFGNQAVNTTSAALSVTLTNSGSAALTITTIAASGDFSQTNTCGASVAAAGTCSISVTFTPTVAGARTGTVSVTDNASGSPQTVSLTGTGTIAPTASPATVTLSGGQTQQFTSNQAVTWSSAPTGAGNIDPASGLYSAPATVATQQTVTITATSQADTTKTATAIVTLSPPSVYSHRRSITIDHTKVPHTDQTNFPVLISGVYPYLATTANGGLAQNASGYDIVFASDFAGATKLDHEIDSYNPATGAISMWVRIPLLSHTCDTIIYLEYGNAAITASQENKTGVWDSNYVGVYHLSNGVTLSANDSTGNANNGTITGATATSGEIDGAASFSGTSQYINLGSSATLGIVGDLTLEAWIKPVEFSQYAGLVGRTNGGVPAPYDWYLVPGSGTPELVVGDGGGGYQFISGIASPSVGVWNSIAAVITGSSATHYLNGSSNGVSSFSQTRVDRGNNTYIATRGDLFTMFKGGMDEVRISKVARSVDWMAAEYANQSSPATFISVGADNTIGVNVCPAAITLSGGQTQQFTATVTNTASQTVAWSSAPAGAGSIDPASGLYTAPASIAAVQTVTITATSQADTTKAATATVTLIPPVPCRNIDSSNPLSAYLSGLFLMNERSGSTDQDLVDFQSATFAGANLPTWNAADPSIVFNGGAPLNSYLNAGTDLTFDKLPIGPLTVIARVYVNAPLAAAGVAEKNDGNTGDSGFVFGWDSSGALRLTVEKSGGSMRVATAAGAIAAGQWMQVAFTWDGTVGSAAAAHLFINATEQAKPFAQDGGGLPPGYANATNQPFRIGSGTYDSQGSLNGKIGYLAVYKGRILTPAEMTQVDAQLPTVAGSCTPPAPPVTLLAAPPSLVALQTSTITANQDVTWVLSGPGALSTTGPSISVAYTAPAPVAAQTVTVTATSQADTTKTASASITLIPVSLSVAPLSEVLSASQLQGFTATVSNTGNTAVTWSINPNVGTISQAGLYTAPAAVATQQTVTVTATSQFDPSKSATATVTLLTAPVTGSMLTLSPQVRGPNVIGTTQTLLATLKDTKGSPVSGTSVSFQVTGPNPASGTATTNGAGTAAFTYSGTKRGTDTVQASSGTVVSNTANVYWLQPSKPISTTAVFGQFFPSDVQSGNPPFLFDTLPTAQPLFTQWFPSITFNPPSGSIPGLTFSNANIGSRPFTDVTLDLNGNYTGTIVAQGNGYGAGADPIASFQAVFTGSYVVANAGDAVITVYVDNTFILGIGGGATRVSGQLDHAPAVTPFQQLPVMGGTSTGIGGFPITVHFPSAGTYPFEVDYVECCSTYFADTLSLVVMTGTPNGNGIAPGMPPTGSLTLTLNTVSPLPAGQSATFTALATDEAGLPIPDANVALTVAGANLLQLNGITNASGQVSFTYNGATAGTDMVSVLGTVSGTLVLSNQVSVTWTSPSPMPPNPPPPGLTVTVSGTGLLALPDPAIYTATATDPRPGSGSIAIAWSQISGPAAVKFSAPQQPVTYVEFSAPGSYMLQVIATDALGSQTLVVGPITVNPAVALSSSQGWILSPINRATVTGIVPITLIPSETLTGGTLTYYPVSNPSAITVLNANTTGTGQLATLDTTLLNNGSYYIELEATDTTGKTQGSGVYIVVAGDYKPGRVTATVTDLVVPAPGLPIQIQRTYDSLLHQDGCADQPDC